MHPLHPAFLDHRSMLTELGGDVVFGGVHRIWPPHRAGDNCRRAPQLAFIILFAFLYNNINILPMLSKCQNNCWNIYLFNSLHYNSAKKFPKHFMFHSCPKYLDSLIYNPCADFGSLAHDEQRLSPKHWNDRLAPSKAEQPTAQRMTTPSCIDIFSASPGRCLHRVV